MGHLKYKTEHVQNQPKPQLERRRSLLVVLLGGFLLLVGGTILLWQVIASQASPSQTSVVSTPTAEPTKSGPGDPQAYYDAVEQYVSQELHMSKAQIKTKLLAGVQLIALAEQQGISATQLRTILLEAEQRGHDVLVHGGYLTQQQSDAGMQDLRSRNLQTLATSIKYDFLDH
ncbi:hypothetical protein KSD_89900 [Ktedonobacter sp. SOSP1-85]|uniref:hypothetical protein n=1 Tax=Ktedonobacter sp. SOSP1-85 TaxID=2778367 RepID=UPI00191534E4|nr:hypothetical protein [Ktedonobacter sp. SOSP1-85]GHO81219.1 hypothetical protein KSD_89900 [Ktedonobacter sp. SOSP1-85]